MTKNVCFSLEDSKEPECDYMKMANCSMKFLNVH